MAVIKCSNCENDILDSEIVCPYCDCPISETLRKLKNGVLPDYTDITDADLTMKVPSVESFKTDGAISDFEEKKAQILKDLNINPEKLSDSDDLKDESDDTAFDETQPEIGAIVSPDNDTADISSKAEELPPTHNTLDDNDDKTDEEAPESFHTAAIPAGNVTEGETVKISREELSKTAEFDDNNNKKQDKTSKANKVILGVTIAGIVVIIVLVCSLIGLIFGNNDDKDKEKQEVPAVVTKEIETDEEKGFSFDAGTLTILENSAMEDYASPNDTPWYKYQNRIKHVVFKDGVEKIGAHAFEGFEKIVDITIPDSVKKIGESAFCNCSALKEIKTMSKAIEEIDDYAFTGCKKLEKIPGFTEEAGFEPGIKRIGIEAFKSCKSFKEFKLPDYTEIGRDAFYGYGENFAIVCKTSSEAYDYAIEKGIPTKLGFGDDESNNEEENPDENKEPPKAPTQEPKPSQNKEPQEEPPKKEPQNNDTPSKPQQNPQKTLPELMKELESASSQEEKDRILGEIDKITQ